MESFFRTYEEFIHIGDTVVYKFLPFDVILDLCLAVYLLAQRLAATQPGYLYQIFNNLKAIDDKKAVRQNFGYHSRLDSAQTILHKSYLSSPPFSHSLLLILEGLPMFHIYTS